LKGKEFGTRPPASERPRGVEMARVRRVRKLKEKDSRETYHKRATADRDEEIKRTLNIGLEEKRENPGVEH
tara:strand:- start:311 stop:523 length:213 start_codon:yes stop_codon:yes gene_type:complete